jgi:copper(I)-binding protein
LTQSGHSILGIVAMRSDGGTPFRQSQIPAVIVHVASLVIADLNGENMSNSPTKARLSTQGFVPVAYLLAATATLACSASASHAADYDVGSIHIAQPWSRATPKGAKAGAGYMTITNKGTTPDKVSCVSDDASAQCEIHSMTMEGGVMKMRPVEGGLEIKPGETVTLAPSGFHVMFRDLKHPLEEGKTVKATLKFDKAGTVDVEYPVVAIGAPAPGAAAGGTMKMQGPGGGMMKMDKH